MNMNVTADGTAARETEELSVFSFGVQADHKPAATKCFRPSICHLH